jgi:hypothetical protein
MKEEGGRARKHTKKAYQTKATEGTRQGRYHSGSKHVNNAKGETKHERRVEEEPRNPRRTREGRQTEARKQKQGTSKEERESKQEKRGERTIPEKEEGRERAREKQEKSEGEKSAKYCGSANSTTSIWFEITTCFFLDCCAFSYSTVCAFPSFPFLLFLLLLLS